MNALANFAAKQAGIPAGDIAKAQEALKAVQGAAAANPNAMGFLKNAASQLGSNPMGMPGQAPVPTSGGLLSADNALAVKSLVEAGFSKETAVFMVTGQSLPPMAGGKRKKTRKVKTTFAMRRKSIRHKVDSRTVQ